MVFIPLIQPGTALTTAITPFSTNSISPVNVSAGDQTIPQRLASSDYASVARLKGPEAFHGPSAIGIMAMGGSAVSKPANYAEAMASIPRERPSEKKLTLQWPIHFQNLSPNSVIRQLAMLSLGLVSEVEDPIVRVTLGAGLLCPGTLPFLSPVLQIMLCGLIFLSILPRMAWFAGMPSTGRGGLRYLLQLGLLDYDFAGKQVLDIGSGGSLFAALVNFLYGSSGAEAIPMDLNFNPRSKLGIRANAGSIPFPDQSFDLITNNWLYAHYYDFTEGVPMLEEMIRVTKPGGRISIGFSVTQFFERIIKSLQGHPAVAHVFKTPPFTLTQGLTIILRDPKPGAKEIQEYYRSLESKGQINVPWRSSTFEGADIHSHLDRLKSGDTMDRVIYIRWLRRLKNASMEIEPSYIETLTHWMDEEKGDELLRMVIITFFMEREEHRDAFKTAWRKLTNEERNMAMRLWLSSGDHWSRLPKMPYDSLDAEYDGDVVQQRQGLIEWLEREKAVQQAYENGRWASIGHF